MPKTPLRAAMAACGGIAGLTLDAAARSPDFEVVAIQDPSPEAVRRVGERYGIHRRHREFQELLTEDVDFVVINGPNDVHLPQVRAAAAAKKHCLVQKPMAPNLAEAKAMVLAAGESGVRLGVTMFELGKPLHHELKEMVAAGWFGDPVMIQAVAAHDTYLKTPPPEDNWRRDPKRVGGAAFIQLAVHQVNLACWLLDREVESVFAAGTRGHTVFEDETALTTLRFAGGVLGHFAASYAVDLWSFSLLGTRGRVSLSGEHVVMKGRNAFEGGILCYGTPGLEVAVPMAELAAAITAREDEVEIHGAFARWLGGRGEYPCTGEHGLRDMRVVDAVYRSLADGKKISVTAAPDPR